MNDQISQLDLLEANVQKLSERIPDVPLTGIMLCRLIMHLGREMAAMLEHEIRPYGLAEAEFRVLTTLFSQPEGVAHPSDLCMRASQSPANMSRISDALVSRDLITRVLSVHDRRRMVLRITAQGEDLVRELLPKVFVPLRAMAMSFPQDEQRALVAQLKRFGLQLREQTVHELPQSAP
ncbi:MAG: MarR family transcriptional regulator [Pseudomonadota bacterium]|nr:MarR family transcriptional regulator [Pseudomonadota bacterium]